MTGSSGVREVHTPPGEILHPLRKLHPYAKFCTPMKKSKVGQFNSTLMQLSPKSVIFFLFNHKSFRLRRAIAG